MVQIVRSDTYRIRITMDKFRKLPLKGTTIRLHRDVWNNPKEFFCQIETNDTNPFNPKKESYKETIDKVLENIDVRQDHIREIKPNNLFNTKGKLEWWTQNTEDNIKKLTRFKDTKYDKILDFTDKIIGSNNKPMGKVDLKYV